MSTDIPLLTGQSQISVLPSGGSYDFQYFSSTGGITSGSVTFTDVETGRTDIRNKFRVKGNEGGKEAESERK